MLPITLTKKQKVLIVGAGRACEIKLKVLSAHDCDITVVSKEFLCEIDSSIEKIEKSFDELDYHFFMEYDLIYIAIALDDTTLVEKLAKTKLINVLSNPNLSNFVHPCTRSDGDVIVSVNNLHSPNPKKACKLAKWLVDSIKSFK
jgi:siroheme synthase (precorrin-2 oxidase/ferrochelatase)